MTLSKLLREAGIKHFTATEITKGRAIPEKYLENIIPTVKYADFMREQLGFKITCSNSYRTWAYHVQLYKSLGYKDREIPQKSLHLVFNALDLHPVSFDPIQLKEMHRFSKIKFAIYLTFKGERIRLGNEDLGTGYYSNFMHSDSRGVLGRSSPHFWGDSAAE